jgi:hypothetical protein
MQLLRTINQEIEDFKNRQIHIVPGLTFNQYDTLLQIFFYYNSKFQTGEIDDDGDKKYFFNIVKNPCKVYSKAIDFDTKNIRLLTAGGGDPLNTWFMERDLKYWMRNKKFGKVLNRIFSELPIYGSVVLKIVDGHPYFVDLRNFVVDQSADTLDEANYKTEIHNYTPESFRKAAKVMKWGEDKVNEVIDLFHRMRDTSHIRVYERYGEIPKENDDGTFDYQYSRSFVADVGVDEFDQYGNMTMAHPGIELSVEKWDGHPYREFHAEKIPGRWLGYGVVEALFEPQIRQNELANVQAKTTYWAGLRLWQTRDPATNRNLYSDAKNGEVVSSDDRIEPIDMADRNLSFFDSEHSKWMRNRDELTFSYDAVQGERSPAGTPLGSTQISISQTLSYFEGIQENVAMDVKDMLYEVIIPHFEKESSVEHTLRLVGGDLNTYIEMVKNKMVLEETIRMATQNGAIPSKAEVDALEIGIVESIKQEKEKILTVPKNAYKDVEYDVDIDITGESVDTRVRYATRFAILQAVTADPMMLKDPVKKKIIEGMCEDGGINPADIFGVETRDSVDMIPPEMARAGGGVSAAALGSKIPGSATQTI